MNTDIIIMESDSTVHEAIKLMKEKQQRSVIASYKGEVMGLVSKTDILRLHLKEETHLKSNCVK